MKKLILFLICFGLLMGAAYAQPMMSLLAASGTQVLFYDTFTDTDDTLLTAHTPDIDVSGGGWSAINTGLKIVSNKATGVMDVNPRKSFFNTGASDGTFSVDIKAGSFGYILFRFVDADNWWCVQARTGDGWFVLYENVAGSATVRDTGGTAVVSTDYKYTIVLNGNSISVNEATQGEILSYTSSVHNNATKYGLDLSNMGTVETWDNIKFED